MMYKRNGFKILHPDRLCVEGYGFKSQVYMRCKIFENLMNQDRNMNISINEIQLINLIACKYLWRVLIYKPNSNDDNMQEVFIVTVFYIPNKTSCMMML